MAASVYINQSDLNKAFRDLDRVGKAMNDEDWRREVMRNAAQFVAVAAQKRQVKSDTVHYYYKNRVKGKRRSKGDAINDRVRILPGNLKLSIQHLEKLKKSPNAVIGPNIKGRLGNLKNLGRSPANTSGFYAWMAQRTYKGAEDFRRDIMEPALAQTSSAVVSYVTRKVAQNLDSVRNQLSLFG